MNRALFREVLAPALLLAAPSIVGGQSASAPISVCDLHLTVIQLRVADSLPMRLNDVRQTLRPPRGMRLILAAIRGTTPTDTILTVSAADFGAHHQEGISPARAIMFTEPTDTSSWTAADLGGSTSVNRIVRAGGFGWYVAFFVPAATSEVSITFPSRLSGARGIP